MTGPTINGRASKGCRDRGRPRIDIAALQDALTEYEIARALANYLPGEPQFASLAAHKFARANTVLAALSTMEEPETPS